MDPVWVDLWWSLRFLILISARNGCGDGPGLGNAALEATELFSILLHVAPPTAPTSSRTPRSYLYASLTSRPVTGSFSYSTVFTDQLLLTGQGLAKS